MAKIALRAYIRDIEGLLEGRQFDEASAHCKQILRYFPKDIATYRLLGKTYLECQRYSDAADILQRVLSSLPDEFVSHVGMSIIREDEGNLDEAIWHMERAFEVQPSNKAIQEELRRLYGKRDGLEPPKIRLTRGALARMYTKGELFPQAIAETRAALNEDPSRMDMQLLLAQNYFRTGQRVDAADACNIMLRKLPYCLEANRIMAVILENSERASDAIPYRRRVISLNPYEAYISPTTPTAEKVPEATVTLERLTWQPGQKPGQSFQPDWAASLGVKVSDEGEPDETLPIWLAEVGAAGAVVAEAVDKLENQPSETAPFVGSSAIEPSIQPAPASEDEIPDWMKAAGWMPATGAAVEGPMQLEEEEEELPAGTFDDLDVAAVPDWLKEMAPEMDQSGEQPEWVKTMAGAEAAAALSPKDEWVPEFPETAATDESDMGEEGGPGFLKAAGVAAVAVGAAAFVSDRDQETIQPDAAPFEAAAEAGVVSTAASQEMPDWLQDMAPPPGEAAIAAEMPATPGAASSDEYPDWMKDLESEVQEESVTAEREAEITIPPALPAEEMTFGESTAEPEGEGVPSWLKDLAPPAEAGEPEGELTPPVEEHTGVTGWLHDVSTPAVVAGAAVVASQLPEKEAEETPQEIPFDSVLPTVAAAGVLAAESEPAPAESAFEPAEAGIVVEPEAAQSPAMAEDQPLEPVPDWLQDFGAAEAPGEALPVDEAIKLETTEELPDWVKAMAPETSAVEQPAQEPFAPVEVIPAAPAGIEEPEDEGGLGVLGVALAAGLAAAARPEEEPEPTGMEPTGMEPPSMEPVAITAIPVEETLPDWMREMEAVPPERPGEEVSSIAEFPVEAAPDAPLAFAAATFAADKAAVKPEKSEDALSEWLSEVGGDEMVIVGPLEAQPTQPGDMLEGEVPAWLEEMASQGGTTDLEQGQVPDWLKEMVPDGAVSEAGNEEFPILPIVDVAAAAYAVEKAPSWLEEPAAIPPADETPDWLKEFGGEEPSIEALPPEAVPAEAEAAEAAEIPSWMKELAPESMEAETPEIEAALPLEAAQPELTEEETPEGGFLPVAAAAAAAAWIAGQEENAEEIPAPVEELPAGEEAISTAPVPGGEPAMEAPEVGALTSEEISEMDMDAAFAWLESLAVKQGADEALLLTPEERQETPPEWVTLAAEEAPSGMPVMGEEEALSEELEMPEEPGHPGMVPAGLAAGLAAAALLHGEGEAEALPVAAETETAGEGEALTAEAALAAAGEPEAIEQPEAIVQPETELQPVEMEHAEAELTAEPELQPEAEVQAEPPELLGEEIPIVGLAAPVAQAEPAQDWLQAMETPPIEGDTKPRRVAPPAEAAEIAEEKPEERAPWLEGAALAAAAAAVLAQPEGEKAEAPPEDLEPVAPVVEIPPAAEPGMPSEMDADAAFAWLESLAVKQGADEALLLTPEERLDAPPQWVTEIQEEAAAEQPVEGVETLQPEIPSEAAPELLEAALLASELAETPLPTPEAIEPEAALLPAELPLEAEAFEVEAPADFVPVEAAPELLDAALLASAAQVEQAPLPPAEKVDLNQASLVELERLPGVGFILAQKILAYRDEYGPFTSLFDLERIPGLNPDTLQELEPWVTVAPAPPSIILPHLAVEGPQELVTAREAILTGDLSGALEQYTGLIQQKRYLIDIVRDLQDAVAVNPRDSDLWQVLGDAYMREDQVQAALEAYTKAEQLLAY